MSETCSVLGCDHPTTRRGLCHGHYSRWYRAVSVPVSVSEAGVLQSFPATYPWQGPKTAQYAQVGNAIPPLLAAHIIAALDGAP